MWFSSMVTAVISPASTRLRNSLNFISVGAVWPFCSIVTTTRSIRSRPTQTARFR
jgi:hypothetical protein